MQLPTENYFNKTSPSLVDHDFRVGEDITQEKMNEELIEIVSKSLPHEEVLVSGPKNSKPIKILSDSSQEESSTVVKAENVGISTLLPESTLPSVEMLDKMTQELKLALEAFEDNKDFSFLESALHKANEKIESLIKQNVNLNTDEPLMKSLENYRAKFKECQKQKTTQTVDIVVSDMWKYIKRQFEEEEKSYLKYKNSPRFDGEDREYRLPPRKGKIVEEAKKFAKSSFAHSFRMGNHIFVITNTLPGGNAIPAVWVQWQNQLARGGASLIYRGHNIRDMDKKVNLERSDVMKVPTGSSQEEMLRAQNDLKNEFFVTGEIHKNGRKIGVVPQPHTFVYGYEMGFLTEMQSMNGRELGENLRKGDMTLNSIQLDKVTDQVISGLEVVHDTGYYHGDGKSDNLLWNDKREELMICDFGGARKFSELVPLDKFPSIHAIFGAHTPPYVSYDIYIEILNILEEKKELYEKETTAIKENLLKEILKNDIEPLLIKNDKFALGLAIFESLTGKKLPFYKNKSKNDYLRMPSFTLTNRKNIEQTIEKQAEKFNWSDKTKNSIKHLLSEGDISNQVVIMSSPAIKLGKATGDTNQIIFGNNHMTPDYIKTMDKLTSEIVNYLNQLLKPESHGISDAEKLEILTAIKDLKKAYTYALKQRKQIDVYEDDLLKIMRDEFIPQKINLIIELLGQTNV